MFGCGARQRRGSWAHASSSGRTTRPPEVSPSHHVRQNSVASDPSTTPPASIESVPTVALIAVAAPSATSMPPTCSTRSIAAFGPMSRRSSSAPTMISAMLPVCWPSRLPIGKLLSSSRRFAVDDQLAEQDARPPADAPQVERGDPEPGRGPDRGHRCGVSQRLAELRGSVVGGAEDEHAGQVACRWPSQADPRPLAAGRPYGLELCLRGDRRSPRLKRNRDRATRSR